MVSIDPNLLYANLHCMPAPLPLPLYTYSLLSCPITPPLCSSLPSCPETSLVYRIPITSSSFVLHLLPLPLSLYHLCLYSLLFPYKCILLSVPSPLPPSLPVSFTAVFCPHKHLISVSWFLPCLIRCSWPVSVTLSEQQQQKNCQHFRK